MKKNQKKLLAVIGAFLMVSFLVMGSLPSNSGGHTKGLPVAYIGKTPIYADERKQAENEWRMIERSYFADYNDPQLAREIEMFGTEIIQNPRMFSYLKQEAAQHGITLLPANELVGPVISKQMRDHPDLFLLLINEAEQRGINLSDDVVNTAVQNQIHSLTGQAPDAAYQSAVRHLLMVQMLHNQLVGDMKRSEPKWSHDLAEQYRTVRLNLVEFNADHLLRATTQPTTQQAENLFDAYKSVLPDSSGKPAGDVLGFGYEIPDRVKLQYLTISRDEVLKAAEEAYRKPTDKPGQLPYDLQVKALEYYLQNQTEFVRPAPETKPTTEPTTAPLASATTQPTTVPAALVTTQPTTAPVALATTQPTAQPTTRPATIASATTQPSPATQPTTVATTEPVIPPGPTTRPIAEVQDEIIAKLLKDETDELEKKISDSIHEKLTDGWLAWSSAHPTTQPATAATWPAVSAPPATNASAEDPRHPATAQPTGYPSYKYLENVAQEIEREFKVLPDVAQVPEWSDAKALEALPGIGSSKSADQLFAASIENAAAFAVDPARKSSGLQTWQPSGIFADLKNNDYIYRLTDAGPAHAPDLVSILPRVQEDARLQAAYDSANEQAKKFVDEAKRESFSRAALDAGIIPISTGEFNVEQLKFSPDEGIPNFKAGAAAITELIAKTNELLSQASTENPRPIIVVPMPGEKMVVVAQLADVSLPVSERQRVAYRLQFNRSGVQDSEKLAKSYFNYDTVVKRIDYKPESKDKSGGS